MIRATPIAPALLPLEIKKTGLSSFSFCFTITVVGGAVDALSFIEEQSSVTWTLESAVR